MSTRYGKRKTKWWPECFNQSSVFYVCDHHLFGHNLQTTLLNIVNNSQWQLFRRMLSTHLRVKTRFLKKLILKEACFSLRPWDFIFRLEYIKERIIFLKKMLSAFKLPLAANLGEHLDWKRQQLIQEYIGKSAENVIFLLYPPVEVMETMNKRIGCLGRRLKEGKKLDHQKDLLSGHSP